jgi:hypothetical protein
MHRENRLAGDVDGLAQAIERQPFRQRLGGIRLAVDKQVLAVGPDDEVEQHLALRGQQSGPDRQFARDVLGDEALEKRAYILVGGARGEAQHGAVGKKGCFHRR